MIYVGPFDSRVSFDVSGVRLSPKASSNRGLDRNTGREFHAPEAVYWRGVGAAKEREHTALREVATELKEKYPESVCRLNRSG